MINDDISIVCPEQRMWGVSSAIGVEQREREREVVVVSDGQTVGRPVQTDSRRVRQSDGRTDSLTVDGQTVRRSDGQMVGRSDGQMVGWMVGWSDGRTVRQSDGVGVQTPTCGCPDTHR